MVFLQLVLGVVLITQTVGVDSRIIFPDYVSRFYPRPSNGFNNILDEIKKSNNLKKNNNYNNNFNKVKPVVEENISTAASNNNFDWNLIKAILKKENQNTIISSYSVKLILSILGKAIPENKESRKELSVVMPNLRSVNDEYSYFRKTLQSLEEQNENFNVSLASYIYIDKSYENSIDKNYVALAKNNYNTNLNTVEFRELEKTANLINKQIDENTRGHIQNFIEPSSLSDMKALFLNAIYFEALWEIEFPSLGSNIKLKFSVSPDEKVKTEYIIQPKKIYRFGISKELDAKIVRLGYKGGKFAMYVILPNKIDGLNSVIDKLNNNTISLAQSKMKDTDILLGLPKFSIDYSVKLKQVLEQFGIRKIFSSEANLKALSSDKNYLAVSDVLQKSKISINEKGTVAAGATSAGLMERTRTSATFFAKHPFLFFIQDETTGALLFTGKFVKPNL